MTTHEMDRLLRAIKRGMSTPRPADKKQNKEEDPKKKPK